MRISEILENEDRDGETKKFVQPQNGRCLRFRKIGDHFFETIEEHSDQLIICKLLGCDINETMIIISDDVDDHDDLVELTNYIYDKGEFANPPITEEGLTEPNRIVDFKGLRLVISQSSMNFIKITFREAQINKFIQQLLLR